MPPLIFGAQPGLVVLALVLSFRWLLQEHYRRKLTYMPGFTRIQAGSSLLKSHPREAATIAAPSGSVPSPGSSHKL